MAQRQFLSVKSELHAHIFNNTMSAVEIFRCAVQYLKLLPCMCHVLISLPVHCTCTTLETTGHLEIKSHEICMGRNRVHGLSTRFIKI